MCSTCGYVPTLCETGEEALSLLRGGKRFQLVLCDVHLPGISGVDVLKEFRRALGHATPIVMMSSNDQVSLIEQCVVEGADSYMIKPPRQQEVEALWGFVERRRQQVLDGKRRAASLTQCIRMCEAEVSKLQQNRLAAMVRTELQSDLREAGFDGVDGGSFRGDGYGDGHGGGGGLEVTQRMKAAIETASFELLRTISNEGSGAPCRVGLSQLLRMRPTKPPDPDRMEKGIPSRLVHVGHKWLSCL